MPSQQRFIKSSAFRLPASMLAACLVTFSLFVLMGKMIANEAHSEPLPQNPTIYLGEAEYPEETEQKPREEFEEPKHNPPPTRPTSSEPSEKQPTNIDPILRENFVVGPPTGNGVTGGGINSTGVQNRPDFTPWPSYPLDARRNGLEGYVVVELTLDAMGRVLDARIVSANPRRVFDSTTLETVKRWSLPSAAPASGVHTVQRRLDFSLDQ